ncbi:MAG: hypothetical protein IKR83_01160 [Bacteroidales bacterium]|nr:hypothetical protein [Bacteroidales bacterium]
MKRLTIIVMLLAGWSAGAQFVIDKGGENRHIDIDWMLDARYVGQMQDQTVWVCQARNGWQIIGADHQMEPVRKHGLKTGADELLAATMAGDTVTMVLADRHSNRRTDVLLARCTAAGEWRVDTLATYAHEKKDRCLMWGAVSPSGNYIGLCSIVEYTDIKQYSAYISLLTSSGMRAYRQEYPLGTMDQMYVTDDGRIATLGTEQEGKTLHVIINYSDRDHIETNEALVTCEPPRELRIVNVAGSRLLAIGTVSGSGFRGAEELCGGDIAFAFDLDSAKLIGFNIRPFHNEDVNIFYNKPTKKIQHELFCEHATPLGFAAMPYGGVMVTGRNYEKITLADNGTEEHSFARVGLHVVAVDLDGNFAWVRNLRRNDMQKKNPVLLNIGLMPMGDTICVIKSENRKFPLGYEIGKEAKLLKMGDKNNLVVYSISAEGEVHKDILEAKSKHSLLKVTGNGDILTVHSSRLRHIKLTRL